MLSSRSKTDRQKQYKVSQSAFVKTKTLQDEEEENEVTVNTVPVRFISL